MLGLFGLTSGDQTRVGARIRFFRETSLSSSGCSPLVTVVVRHPATPVGSIMWAVEKRFVLRTVARKRGNPNWGKPMEAVRDVPTAFEEQVGKLGLNDQTCATSEELRRWCICNKDRCYIPEWLLKRWGIAVDPNVSG